ncbi:MAG: arsinothricin resistance N-acetyltransferase ArsN1 family A [Thermomicrobiales bacterium]
MTTHERQIVRPATSLDIEAITDIYNEGIADRVATLETELRTPAERQSWLESRDDRTPVFVAEREGEVAGWGALNRFNPREAYRHVADFSIYVARDHRGQGIGSMLLTTLIESARDLSYHKLVLAAFPFNTGGMRLYRRHGFREVGIYREQGVLDGAWVDTIIMELILDNNPPPQANLRKR